MLIRVENFDDFYANYIIRDEPNMFANDDFSDLYANYILSDSREAESNVWFPRSNYHVTQVEMKQYIYIRFTFVKIIVIQPSD